jgi:thiamine-phosphate pyrophosphorylase
MHIYQYNFFYFINQYDPGSLNKLPKNTSLIYRNYDEKINLKELVSIKKICKRKKIKFYLSNNIKLALKLNLDGAYIPAFNKGILHNGYSFKKNFTILGSAHNLREIKIKQTQNVQNIFISPIFFNPKNKYLLGIYRFMLLKKYIYKQVTCLGGVNSKNLKLLRMLNIKNIAGISYFKLL